MLPQLEIDDMFKQTRLEYENCQEKNWIILPQQFFRYSQGGSFGPTKFPAVLVSSDQLFILTIGHQFLRCSLSQIQPKDLYQVQETLKELCEFSTVWADRADLGSEKLFSELTSIFSRKTHDNFQIDIQKINQIKKSWAPLFSIIKHIFLIIKKTHFNILDTCQVKS